MGNWTGGDDGGAEMTAGGLGVAAPQLVARLATKSRSAAATDSRNAGGPTAKASRSADSMLIREWWMRIAILQYSIFAAGRLNRETP